MQRELRHAIVLAAGVGLSGVLSFAYLIIAGRRLGPSLYAEFSAGVALGTLAAYCFGWTSIVLGQASARYASRNEVGKIRFLTARFNMALLVGGAVVSPLVFMLAPRIADALNFRSSTTVIAAFGVMLSALLASGVRAAIRGIQRYTVHSAGVVIETALRLGLGVMVLVFIPRPAAAIGVYIVAAAVVAFASAILVARLGTATPVAGAELRFLWRFVLPSIVVVVTLAGLQNIDLLIVKRLFDPEIAGIYAAASTVAKAAAMLVLPFDALLLPRLSYLREIDASRIPGTVFRVLSYCLAVAAGGTVIVAAFAPQIVHVLYGQRFAAAAPLLFPLAVFLFAVYLSYFACQVLISIHRFRWISIFAAGLCTELLLLAALHESPSQIATIIAVNQVATFVILAVAVLVELSRHVPAATIDVSAAPELMD